MNIDFLKYCSDNKTSDYLDMLLNQDYLPIVTKATRITDHTSTIIDHIYTNSPQNVAESGICLVHCKKSLSILTQKAE